MEGRGAAGTEMSKGRRGEGEGSEGMEGYEGEGKERGDQIL